MISVELYPSNTPDREGDKTNPLKRLPIEVKATVVRDQPYTSIHIDLVEKLNLVEDEEFYLSFPGEGGICGIQYYLLELQIVGLTESITTPVIAHFNTVSYKKLIIGSTLMDENGYSIKRCEDKTQAWLNAE